MMTMLATGLQTGLGVMGTMGQAKAEKSAAEHNALLAKQGADEEIAGGQQKAAAELRQAKLAQSNLRAAAGASGAGANDKTVIDIWGDIGAEGDYNAKSAMAAGKARAQGIKHQADLGLWKADANSRLARLTAAGQVVGGVSKMAGGYGKMKAKYGGYKGSTKRAWG